MFSLETADLTTVDTAAYRFVGLSIKWLSHLITPSLDTQRLRLSGGASRPARGVLLGVFRSWIGIRLFKEIEIFLQYPITLTIPTFGITQLL